MDKEEIKVAVDLLVDTNNYAALKKALRELIETKESLPRRFAGELAPLNALIGLSNISEEAFENVLALVETKRKVTPETGKVDYQRDYMRQRRARLATALKIEEMERGKSLSPEARKKFKDNQQVVWQKARDAYIASHGELDWKERNLVTSDFWEKIDAQLEQHLVDARTKRKR